MYVDTDVDSSRNNHTNGQVASDTRIVLISGINKAIEPFVCPGKGITLQENPPKSKT